MTDAPLLPDRAVADLPARRRAPVPGDTLAAAARIVDDVTRRGEAALVEYAARFGELADGALVLGREALDAALGRVPAADRALLERTAERIRRFAAAQREALGDVELTADGLAMGHRVVPLGRAGCYAPGGRYPYPSTVLMTAVTARVAGVAEVWVASPRPSAVTLAAAAVAEADAVLCAGGAHAVAALAYGAGPVPPCDAVVGPGNVWVTAAKQLVAGRVRIDMLAGPSELVVLADATADPATVAADLIAQAEHDVVALPVLVATDAALVERVRAALAAQLDGLPTAAVARPALAHGFAVVVAGIDAGVEVCERLAPEHLQVMTADADAVAARLRSYGSLFVGSGAAEVLGDYGAGPNHVLPTGGTAAAFSGLSVLTFLKTPTWLRRVDPGAATVAADAVRLARHEGLEGHARAAERRR